MPPEILNRNHPKSFKRHVADVIIPAVALGGAAVGGITLRQHRELTHKSVELNPLLRKLADLEQRSIGVAEPYTWAAVHRIHHRWTDVSGFPFYEIHHAMKAAKERNLDIPETFEHLDPFVDKFDKETVARIGSLADAEIRDRMGEKYQEPTLEDKSNEDILAILNPTEPRYHYPEQINKQTAEDFTQNDIAQILLTDPHSPALMQRENGVQGVAIGNIGLYTYAADLFRRIPEIRPEDLQIPPDEDGRSTKAAVIGGFVLPAVATFLNDRDFSAKGVLKAAVKGAAINGIKIGMEAVGGNITNSAGHMGDPIEDELREAFTKTRYNIKLRSDGTLSTDTIGKGILGWLISKLTFDEVGGQDIHHRYPDLIAYTIKMGLDAWKDAPWGKSIEALADSDKFPLIKRGKGFEGERPDVPSDAVVLIQKARADQYAREHTVFAA